MKKFIHTSLQEAARLGKAAILTVAVLAGAAIVGAAAPGGVPPANNVAAPINISTNDQVKTGSLTIGTAAGEVLIVGSSPSHTVISGTAMDAAGKITTSEIIIQGTPGCEPGPGKVLKAVNSTGLACWSTP